MNTYNFEAFEWFVPEEKSVFAITITGCDTLNVNPKLLEQLPSHIAIGIGERGRVLGLRENAKGYRLPKSGTVKGPSKELITRLVKLGVRIPARYSVTKNGDLWVGVLETQAPPSLNTKKVTAKKRETELTGLLGEVTPS